MAPSKGTERRPRPRTRPPSSQPPPRPGISDTQSLSDRLLPPLFFAFLIIAFTGSVALLLWSPSPPSDRELTEEELRILSGTSSPGESDGSSARAAGSDAATGSAALYVTTVPSGAVVSVDGKVVGTTPLRQRNLDARWHLVSVDDPALGSKDTLVYLEEGVSTSVALSLRAPVERAEAPGEVAEEPEPTPEAPAPEPTPARRTESNREPTSSTPTSGAISVRVNPSNVPVQLDGETVGVAPLDLDDVSTGSHTLTFFLPGYETATVDVNVRPGAREVVDISLRPQQGTLSVLVRPWGTVYVDGVLRAQDTDVSVELALPVGSHEVRVEHPTLGTETRTVEVRPQSTTSAVFDLN